MYRELNIGGPEGDIKVNINKSLLEDLTMKVASRFTVTRVWQTLQVMECIAMHVFYATLQL